MDTIYNPDDGSSYSNSHIIRVINYSVKVYPHLKTKTVDTEVTYTLEVKQKSNVIVFDNIKLKVASVLFGEHECKFTISNEETPIGSPLTVQLPNPLEEGAVQVPLVIKSSAIEPPSLTWGDYVFTQNQPIYCRSLFPCQDTPSSKSTFEIQIFLDQDDKHLNIFASGIKKQGSDVFVMEVPIPTYLFAFLIGNFEYRKLNDRLGVVAEPSIIENVCQEVEEAEKFLSAIEKILFEYKFGVYNICVLPKSFPYGGMENPIITFVSPSVVTGDKTGLPVVIHEMTHSWTGNLVSCKNWENFWMNEGFTVFVENKTIKELYGEELYQLNCLLDQQSLLKIIDNFGKDHPYTQLHPTLNHANPDDAFSVVPYFKGMIFLTYQESLIGEQHFSKILITFLQKYERKSVDYKDWKAHLEQYLSANKIELKQQIDWETWVHKPGYPPRLDLFRSHHMEHLRSVVTNHKVNQEQLFSVLQEAMFDFSPLNIKRLELLLSQLEKQGITFEQAKSIEEKFKLSELLLNFELATEWFKICLKAGYSDILERLDSKILKRIGRMKFIRPLYRYLKKFDESTALKYFEENKQHYSIIANELIKKDLGIADA